MTPEDAIPQEVAEFLATYISSLEQLEVLTLLCEQPSRVWHPKELFEIIKSNQTSIENRLRAFAAAGLVVADPASGTYRYSPPDEEIRQRAAAVVAFYRQRPVRTIEIIFSSRTDPAQTFANAFNIRRKE